MVRTCVFVFVSLCLAAPASAADSTPLLLQQPSLSRTHIVFVTGGDLWSVPRSPPISVVTPWRTLLCAVPSRSSMPPDWSMMSTKPGAT